MKINESEVEQKRRLLQAIMQCRVDVFDIKQKRQAKETELAAVVEGLEKELNKQQKVIFTLEQELAKFKEGDQ